MMSREDVETTKVLERILIAVSHVDLLVHGNGSPRSIYLKATYYI